MELKSVLIACVVILDLHQRAQLFPYSQHEVGACGGGHLRITSVNGTWALSPGHRRAF